jgi:hypothetical protein
MHYADYNDILKPLPPPPAGKTWRKIRVENPEVEGEFTRWALVDRPPGMEEGEQEESFPEEHDTDGDSDFIIVSFWRWTTRPEASELLVHRARWCSVYSIRSCRRIQSRG